MLEAPPNGQGAIALLILGLLERFRLDRLDPDGPERFHLQMEAARAAYAVRDAWLADPDCMPVGPAALFSDALVDRLAAGIDPQRRNPALGGAQPIGSDTTYLTVADRDGRLVSLIASLYRAFGSGIVTPRFGIALQNRGACFVLTPGHPNVYGPGKRPLHTIIPAMAREGGRAVLSFGVMGGGYQPVGHAHVLENMLDHRLDPQAALEVPRMFFDADGALLAESTVPAATLDGLAARGHTVLRSPTPHGGGQIIRVDRERGVLVGGSDPRKDGCALGF